ncbi:MAG: M15 family metallopeptidase [Oscillospiraceae bacterium]|nr:M15 family metallopeptidase [Oscillospiraceae bacterium]
MEHYSGRRQKSRQRQRRRRRTLFAKVLAFVILIAVSIVAYTHLMADTGNSGYSTVSTSTVSHRFPSFNTELPISDIEDTQYLKLVNRNLSINTPVEPSLLAPIWPGVSVRAVDITLHETARSAMLKLYQAAERDEIHNLFVASGYRTHEEQRNLYENASDRRYVMPPGHSEHQLGLAVDILLTTGSIRGTSEAMWLTENAPEFGLILSYPYHKQEITGVAYEPWHFRYVGRVHASVMLQHDFVLEEYITFLQETVGIQVEFDEENWYILYQRPIDGKIFVPHDMDFNVSSTNTGGFIITAWR